MCGKHGWSSENLMKLFTVGVCFAVIVTLGISTWLIQDAIATTNFSIHATGSQVPTEFIGDPDGFLRGQLKMNQNQKTIEWDFIYDKINTIVSIGVFGPIGTTSSDWGTLALPLCGPPSTKVCDTTIPRKVTGKIDIIMPGHQSPRSIITAIRDAPAFYTLCVSVTTNAGAAISVCSVLIPG